MPKGWHIQFSDGDKVRIFKVGITDQDEAIRAVTEDRSDVSGIVVLPLKEGEFEKLAMKEGQIIESAQIN